MRPECGIDGCHNDSVTAYPPFRCGVHSNPLQHPEVEHAAALGYAQARSGGDFFNERSEVVYFNDVRDLGFDKALKKAKEGRRRLEEECRAGVYPPPRSHCAVCQSSAPCTCRIIVPDDIARELAAKAEGYEERMIKQGAKAFLADPNFGKVVMLEARVDELLASNNEEVARRRAAEDKLGAVARALRDYAYFLETK